MTSALHAQTVAAVAPRDPDLVMRLSRMGSAHPMRLSFLRVLLRRVQAEGWCFDRPLWQVDTKGVSSPPLGMPPLRWSMASRPRLILIGWRPMCRCKRRAASA